MARHFISVATEGCMDLRWLSTSLSAFFYLSFLKEESSFNFFLLERWRSFTSKRTPNSRLELIIIEIEEKKVLYWIDFSLVLTETH